ncbi:MAG: hypothetical protein VB957_10785 [Pseudomonadales bacterium]
MRALTLLTMMLTSPMLLAEDYSCSNGSAVRTIEVIYEVQGSPVPCVVSYKKESEGTVEFPWQADNQLDYCEEKAAYLAGRLGQFGWYCERASHQE